MLFPGVVAGLRAYTVKVHAKFPDQEPAIRGIVCLHDTATGELLAVMDSTHPDRRSHRRRRSPPTLAAPMPTWSRSSAPASKVGSSPASSPRSGRSGASSSTTRRRRAPRRTRRTIAAELALPIEACPTLAAALAPAAIVLAATWSRTPFLDRGNVAAGTHVTTLGPDEPGKAEVAADVITAALFVCDDRGLAVEMGALAGVGLGAEAVGAELGEILAGRHPGRTSDREITVYGGVGLAFQDAVAAVTVYDAARARGYGRAIDFLG